MNGQDLINYIKKHNLENAELDIGISDPLQFVVTVPKTPASDERELVYDFTRDFVYDRYLCTNQISYEEAEKMRDLDLEMAGKIKMTEDDKRKLFYAEVLLKSVSGDKPTWLALGPYTWPMLKEALSDYISKMKKKKNKDEQN